MYIREICASTVSAHLYVLLCLFVDLLVSVSADCVCIYVETCLRT